MQPATEARQGGTCLRFRTKTGQRIEKALDGYACDRLEAELAGVGEVYVETIEEAADLLEALGIAFGQFNAPRTTEVRPMSGGVEPDLLPRN